MKGSKEPILNGKLFGPLRVDDCTWVIEEPDGVHEKFEAESDSDSSEEEGTKKLSKRKVKQRVLGIKALKESKVLHMELAKFDNDQITKELKKGFWLGVMAEGPLMAEVTRQVPFLKNSPLLQKKKPKSIPPDYYDTWLNDKEAGRLWGDGAREDNRKFG